jgi:uncharacterized protein DUF3300
MFERKIWHRGRQKIAALLLSAITCCILATPALAHEPPYYGPRELDRMVSRVALYPDPLLAQTLAAATFPDQVPDAARWADQHHYLSGNELADAIYDDNLPWDPSVQALLPFPSVLDMMASDIGWTAALGDAFLAQQPDVMAAVQRMRHQALAYGYLRTGPQIIVRGGPYITILPARADYIVVPYYDPAVVYVAPRPGIFIGAAIGFRFGVAVGPVFRPWGWGGNRVVWEQRTVYINNARWHRDWGNRTVYVHPYTIRHHEREHEWRDHHELRERSERERWGEREEHRHEARHDERHENHGRGHGHKERDDDRGHDRH